MKYTLFLLLFCGCSSAAASNSSSVDYVEYSDAGVDQKNETFVDVHQDNIDVNNNIPNNEQPQYDPCHGFDSQYIKTEYPCLAEIICNGNFVEYWDRCLKLTCDWAKTEDKTVRCLPTNKQSATLFANASCNDPIAFATLRDLRYIGIVNYADTDHPVKVYSVGSPYTEMFKFYLSEEDGEIKCMETNLPFKFPGLALYHLGNEVDVRVFVAQ